MLSALRSYLVHSAAQVKPLDFQLKYATSYSDAENWQQRKKHNWFCHFFTDMERHNGACELRDGTHIVKTGTILCIFRDFSLDMWLCF